MYGTSFIEFYVYQTDYIDNDYFTNINNDLKANELRLVNVVEDCINVYFVPLAYFSGTSSFSPRIQDPNLWAEQGIIIRNDAPPTTLPHEMGHYFDLFHTFQLWFSSGIPELLDTVYENIARTGSCANWDIAGDLLGDTPADPTARVEFPTINLNCLWINPPMKPLPPDGCGQTNYNPLTNNMMITQVNQCRTTFTENQKSRMNETLMLYRSELLKSLVYLENSANSVNAEGTLHIGSSNYNSGRNALVEEGTYNIGTNNERFNNFQGSGYIYKHNNWNDLSSDFFLSRNIEIITDDRQIGKFNKLNSATIRNVIDGMSYNDGIPIKFNDPWYVKNANDNQSGMGDFISFSSPYNPTGKYNQTTGGVFLNQPYTGTTPVYYSVKSESVQDISLTNTGVPSGRNHKFYFQNWSGTNVNFQNPNALETPVVFTQEGATAQANLKGTQISNSAKAFNSSSQRKMVRTDDGFLHLVYETMGSVWYETSTDNGSTWEMQNNGKPISTSGKQPAIDYCSYYGNEDYNQIVITWQESFNSGTKSKIKAAYFHSIQNGITSNMILKDTKDVATVNSNYGTTDCYPVICLAYSDFNIVYKNGGSGALLSSIGVVNTIYGIYFSINNPITLTGTNSLSVLLQLEKEFLKFT